MLTFSQVLIAGTAIWLVVLVWRMLGDAEYLERLDPGLVKLLGAKLFQGENGRTYAEPPSLRKRLQLSLLFGLTEAILYALFMRWLDAG